jgi:NAD(P)-dependent dehydrogenase (short-subunit alcohol dehydrogenase family)
MNPKPSSRPWSGQDIPDQSGRTVLVTGANSGTGFEAAKALARRGAQVVLACRSTEKAMDAERRIREELPGARVEWTVLDLGSLASIREAARAVQSRHTQLDLLINNAGVMIPPYGRTADGFELQIGTNHLGHFALTGLLLPLLLATPASRIVTMSSMAHKHGRIRFEDLQSENGYRAWAAYGQSKLANLMFTYELQRRLQRAKSATLAVAAHPGWARTGLQRHADGNPLFRVLTCILGPVLSQDAAHGALPLLRAAVDPGVSGAEYYGPGCCGETKGAPIRVRSNEPSHDEGVQRRLWACSEQLTDVVYPI